MAKTPISVEGRPKGFSMSELMDGPTRCPTNMALYVKTNGKHIMILVLNVISYICET